MNLKGNLNDKISSIRIGADITAKLCIHWDCETDSSAPISYVEVSGPYNIEALNSDLNDKISFVMIYA